MLLSRISDISGMLRERADDHVTQLARTKPKLEGTLYRLPVYSRLAYNKLGVATGIGRTAIRQFETLANTKKPRTTFAPLSHRSDAQRAMAEAERLVGSACSYVFEQVSERWDVIAAGREPDTKQRRRLQLVCSGAASDAVKALELLRSCTGASANVVASLLERSGHLFRWNGWKSK